MRIASYGGKRSKETLVRKVSRSKEKAWRAVYQAKFKEERKILRNVIRTSDDQKRDMFKVARRMVKTNQNTIGGGLKLTDYILKIAERIIEKLI